MTQLYDRLSTLYTHDITFVPIALQLVHSLVNQTNLRTNGADNAHHNLEKYKFLLKRYSKSEAIIGKNLALALLHHEHVLREEDIAL